MSLTLTKQQIDARLAKLPPKLGSALSNFDYLEVLEDLGKNHHLNDSQSKQLAKIFGRVIMGFISLPELENIVRDSLELDDGTAKKITATLNQKIFSNLKDNIDKFSQSVSASAASKNILNLKPSPQPDFRRPVITSPPSQSPAKATVSAPVSPVPSPKPLGQLKPFTPPTSISRPSFSTPPIATPTPPLRRQDFPRPAVPSTPFIIHQKSELKPISEPNIPKVAVPQMESLGSRSTPTPPPVEARVEIGSSRRHQQKVAAETPARFEPEQRRVIDYGAINLPKTASPFGRVPNPSSSQISPPPASGPDLKGNTVDLRSSSNNKS